MAPKTCINPLCKSFKNYYPYKSAFLSMPSAFLCRNFVI
ncbi:unnamed protein product [Spirodela intermedia]|uniref:Uncharacterized protein n=1 Tax=Spirodela intermedia TaxID=51605 RepID=A0A7I8J086_SPIIN|nr:unnamed protein product [Spirodela intermedia]CAA6663382.1 unnamed protein product [Spirodela intermedia]